MFDLVDLKTVLDPRGMLSFVEYGDLHPDFHFKRIYYIYNVTGLSERGAHAHRKLHQVMIAINGSFDLELERLGEKSEITLNEPNKAILIYPGTWRILKNFSDDAICLVLASDEYEESDYIRNYACFQRQTKEGRFS